jgi:ABC-type lipoprotein export system ATPase subunit
MGNSNSGKSICINCLESENKIKMLNQMIQELHDLIEIKNNGINMLEQQIYLLEKFSKT